MARPALVAPARFAVGDLVRARSLQAVVLVAAILAGASFVLRSVGAERTDAATAGGARPVEAAPDPSGRGSSDRDPSDREAEVGNSASESNAPPVRRIVPLRAFVVASDRDHCVDDPALDPAAVSALSCSPSGAVARVEIRRFASVAALRARYRALVPEAGAGGNGAVRCAAGRPEERTWSRADAPALVVGRYACRHNGDAAELWWTDETQRVVGMVLRADADLAAAHRWWVRADGRS